jgi:predicted nucleic acid-binding protein
MLDASVLVSVARNDKPATSIVEYARRSGFALHTTAPVVSQVWRNRRQVLLARFLKGLNVHDYHAASMRPVGELMASAGTSDVVDAHLVITAHWLGLDVLTGDPKDINKLVGALTDNAPAVKPWP